MIFKVYNLFDVLTLVNCYICIDFKFSKQQQLIIYNTFSLAANGMQVYELEVLGCLSSSSICQSQLFGQPAHIYPTQCWHLEWEELLTNHQVIIT
jgi:hypothetical protein